MSRRQRQRGQVSYTVWILRMMHDARQEIWLAHDRGFSVTVNIVWDLWVPSGSTTCIQFRVLVENEVIIRSFSRYGQIVGNFANLSLRHFPLINDVLFVCCLFVLFRFVLRMN